MGQIPEQQNWKPATSSIEELERPEASSSEPFPKGDKARIFISYKRGVEPDEQLALEIYEHLGQRHVAFIDQSMVIGTPWAEKIEEELRLSDYLITLLSPQSVGSEMVQGEVETAHRLGSELGKPVILPIRVNFREPFTYPLSAYLNPINWAFWERAGDIPKLLEELDQAIAGKSLTISSETSKRNLISHPDAEALDTLLPQPFPSGQLTSLDLPEGTIELESKFYVERKPDRIAVEVIQRQGVTITIKAPRQMGKSSLLNRTIQAARDAGKQVVFLDFQLFDKQALQDANHFFRSFCVWLSEELEIEDQVEDYWKKDISQSQRCTSYVSRHILKSQTTSIVLAMDEVESMFDTPFRSDFFSMLRSWHNNRAIQPLWKKLDLALVTSTEPYQLIEDLNQSPFNVGRTFELSDFTYEQVHDLNQRHGSPLDTDQEKTLTELVNGQPFLIRKALYLVASNEYSVSDLFAHATDDRGPFGGHLRYHLFRMNNKPELVEGLLQVINRPSQLDEELFFRLRGAGLVKRQGKHVVPRCQLYAAYFQEHLHD